MTGYSLFIKRALNGGPVGTLSPVDTRQSLVHVLLDELVGHVGACLLTPALDHRLHSVRALGWGDSHVHICKSPIPEGLINV